MNLEQLKAILDEHMAQASERIDQAAKMRHKAPDLASKQVWMQNQEYWEGVLSEAQDLYFIITEDEAED